jgi:uncharacterized protein (DUF885 family)
MKYHMLVLLTCLAIYSAGQSSVNNTSARFNQMLNNYYEAYLQLNPSTASYRGDYRYNDQLENSISQPYRDKSRELYTRFQDSLKLFSAASLSARDQLSYRIFEYQLKTSLEEVKLTSYLTPISQMRDFRISFSQMGSGSSTHPFKTVKDYDDFLKRINAFVSITDTAIENMRKGMAIGKVQPRVLIEKVIPQIKAMLVDDVTKSIFYTPVKNLPLGFSVEEKQRITASYTNAINQQIVPTYNRLLSFIEKEYLPRTRETFGLMAQPNGSAEYAFLVKSWTTTNLTPDEVFDIGEKEVKRIRGEMEKVKNEVGFKGTLKEFFAYLGNDQKFFPFKKDEDVTAAFQQIYERIKPHIVKQFNMVPKTAFEIRPIEKYRAATTAANYMGGTPDGSRPGVFYFPVVDATKYSYWRMEDLFLHEAIPGHHFQISLQTENKNIPDMQKVGRYGAYVEGWGLYAERLGKELGLYTDPYQRIGQLQGEMHRAIRLVVDVGIHHKGWSRDKAIKYSLDNEPVSEASAIQEIERYISMPGQALSYKIGELKIMAMRKKAENALGKRFDVRAFHDEVLKDGAMPLEIFENKINAWIKSQGVM